MMTPDKNVCCDDVIVDMSQVPATSPQKKMSWFAETALQITRSVVGFVGAHAGCLALPLIVSTLGVKLDYWGVLMSLPIAVAGVVGVDALLQKTPLCNRQCHTTPLYKERRFGVWARKLTLPIAAAALMNVGHIHYHKIVHAEPSGFDFQDNPELICNPQILFQQGQEKVSAADTSTVTYTPK